MKINRIPITKKALSVNAGKNQLYKRVEKYNANGTMIKVKKM